MLLTKTTWLKKMPSNFLLQIVIQNSGTFLRMKRHLRISGDFRESKFQTFRKSMPPDPLRCLHLGPGVLLSHVILGCHAWSPVMWCRAIFWGKNGKALMKIQKLFVCISRNVSAPAISESQMYLILGSSKCRMWGVLCKGAPNFILPSKTIYATTLLVGGVSFSFFDRD